MEEKINPEASEAISESGAAEEKTAERASEPAAPEKETVKPKKKPKPKTVYLEDKGQTIYSMAALDGKTPEEQEEFEKRRKNAPIITGKERSAMIKAAFTVYGPLLLMLIASFGLAALFLYFFLK